MNTKSLFLSAVLCLVFATPAFAQSAATEATLQRILQRHPGLAKNPSLVNNREWQKEHPNAYKWFRQHPRAMAQTARMGAWEPNGTWHDPDWWYRNNPNWVYQNRQDWIQRYPQWRQDGDWDDDEHVWHDRDWYWHNRREWAEHHHPEWAREEEHEEEEEAEQHGPPYGHAWGHYKHHGHHDDDND